MSRKQICIDRNKRKKIKIGDIKIFSQSPMLQRTNCFVNFPIFLTFEHSDIFFLFIIYSCISYEIATKKSNTLFLKTVINNRTIRLVWKKYYGNWWCREKAWMKEEYE